MAMMTATLMSIVGGSILFGVLLGFAIGYEAGRRDEVSDGDEVT